MWQVQTHCSFSVKCKDKTLGKAIQYISAEPNQSNLNAETSFACLQCNKSDTWL